MTYVVDDSATTVCN